MTSAGGVALPAEAFCCMSIGVGVVSTFLQSMPISVSFCLGYSSVRNVESLSAVMIASAIFGARVSSMLVYTSCVCFCGVRCCGCC